MIAGYFQYLYCVISPPTQFLQLSPRLAMSIVSMGVFICLFAFFGISPLPVTCLAPVGIKETNKGYYFHSLLAVRMMAIQFEVKENCTRHN